MSLARREANARPARAPDDKGATASPPAGTWTLAEGVGGTRCAAHDRGGSEGASGRSQCYLTSMEMFETALGRLVPTNEVQTALEDAILRLLFDYRLNPQNPNNVPMKLSDIARAVSTEEPLVVAALDALMEEQPPLVEEREKFQQDRTFNITGTGVRFVRNMPQGILSVV
jgi:hypothetical protein